MASQDQNGGEIAKIQKALRDSASLKQALAEGDQPAVLARMAQAAANSIQNGGKVLFCGNGGSAADAQHLAAELLVRLRADRERPGLPAMTLATDSSMLTAAANDYGFEHIFARPLQALGKPGDVLVGITTSGNSENVLEALKTAKAAGILAFGFLGGSGGKALGLCDEAIVIPHSDTGRIQEAHITLGHLLVELIEDGLGIG